MKKDAHPNNPPFLIRFYYGESLKRIPARFDHTSMINLLIETLNFTLLELHIEK